MGNVDGQIYIDCQPVGSSKNKVEILTDMGLGIETGHYQNISELLNNSYVKLFLGSVIFIVLLYGIKYSLNFIKPAKGAPVSILPTNPNSKNSG